MEKNGVSTTMKMSTKGPNEDYAQYRANARRDHNSFAKRGKAIDLCTCLGALFLLSFLAYKLGILFVLGDYVSFFF